ncbi:response regulator transcription factor [Dyadobacter sp. 3J3]|uniref:response regulator transcription factor n=1 Tax=Dyadobacter sp. 3J3 TaxID=2606600 RepID=UPI001E42C6F5|nr:LuxR C-terminal-related transcriptional regulator [Dyadobacter sp. 3J3]
MVNEYRILSKEVTYINVTEQRQILERDAYGYSWLSLGIIDLSSNQSALLRVNFQIHNFITGELITIQNKAKINTMSLTTREKEILELISDGKLSKEISWLLKINVHTINTHRQRILEKLDVNNSIEVIYTAKEDGIIR